MQLLDSLLAYLMTLFQLQWLYSAEKYNSIFMNSEWYRIREYAAVAYFNKMSWHSIGITAENHEPSLRISVNRAEIWNGYLSIACVGCQAEGTPWKLATATQPQFPRVVTSLSWTHVTEWSSSNWENYVAVSSICAAPFSNICSIQAGNNSRKLRLRCGCQFPWCTLGLTATQSWLSC
jgi:hypothetical protein